MKSKSLILIILFALLGKLEIAAENIPFHITSTKLCVDIRDFSGCNLQGKATLNVHSDADNLRQVDLKLLCMNIDSVWVNDRQCNNFIYNDTTITVPVTLSIGDSAMVCISYHGVPHVERFGGFGFYDNRTAHNMGVSFNDRPHNYGKSWRPCIDDFCHRSTFDCYYQTPLDRKAVANGVLQECDTTTVSIVNGLKTDSSLVWHWIMKQSIPDYLVNVAVADYRIVHYDYNNGKRVIPIDAYVLPEEEDSAKAAFAIVPKVLAVMEKHFGPYVWDRIGYVSVNSPSGAMEHATNISIPRNPSTSDSYVDILIHELLHHWFGDLVTCKTAGDMWLNEGITSYMVEVVGEELFTQQHLDKYRRYLDSWKVKTPTDSPSYHPLANMPEDETYGVIVYLKGGWVMRQLRMELGDELFFHAMRDYVDEYSFGNASTGDFKMSLEKSTGKDLTPFFTKYVYN